MSRRGELPSAFTKRPGAFQVKRSPGVASLSKMLGQYVPEEARTLELSVVPYLADLTLSEYDGLLSYSITRGDFALFRYLFHRFCYCGYNKAADMAWVNAFKSQENYQIFLYILALDLWEPGPLLIDQAMREHFFLPNIARNQEFIDWFLERKNISAKIEVEGDRYEITEDKELKEDKIPDFDPDNEYSDSELRKYLQTPETRDVVKWIWKHQRKELILGLLNGGFIGQHYLSIEIYNFNNGISIPAYLLRLMHQAYLLSPEDFSIFLIEENLKRFDNFDFYINLQILGHILEDTVSAAVPFSEADQLIISRNILPEEPIPTSDVPTNSEGKYEVIFRHQNYGEILHHIAEYFIMSTNDAIVTTEYWNDYFLFPLKKATYGQLKFYTRFLPPEVYESIIPFLMVFLDDPSTVLELVRDYHYFSRTAMGTIIRSVEPISIEDFSELFSIYLSADFRTTFKTISQQEVRKTAFIQDVQYWSQKDEINPTVLTYYLDYLRRPVDDLHHVMGHKTFLWLYEYRLNHEIPAVVTYDDLNTVLFQARDIPPKIVERIVVDYAGGDVERLQHLSEAIQAHYDHLPLETLFLIGTKVFPSMYIAKENSPEMELLIHLDANSGLLSLEDLNYIPDKFIISACCSCLKVYGTTLKIEGTDQTYAQYFATRGCRIPSFLRPEPNVNEIAAHLEELRKRGGY